MTIKKNFICTIVVIVEIHTIALFATNSLKDSRVGTKQTVIAKIIKIAKFDDIESTMSPCILPLD